RYSVCHLYWNGEPKQISTDALDKLCKALSVRPGQLFEYRSEG
ncbi:MAG: helix-turn-helix domain-containing protein, partial [Blastocatellia bacterium]